ncbi:hypothetical protein SVIO_006870 [Streptomyces violaceusniger]|uniref:Uncharacterized protein n=1 Tax=Streptomyces violaceusniger TaxID=68280 RepID=A0A4D4KPG1_STRVO|nr:hypothetical protein SVIO_006870 [Streptomyces violaceusniger]
MQAELGVQVEGAALTAGGGGLALVHDRVDAVDLKNAREGEAAWATADDGDTGVVFMTEESFSDSWGCAAGYSEPSPNYLALALVKRTVFPERRRE